jgi:regulator of protease activity HflC (stomatin/prohibitin superfamily)
MLDGSVNGVYGRIQEANMAGIRFSRNRGSIGVGLAALLGILAITLLFFAVVVIESGNVGVKKTLGKIQPEEITPGLSLIIPAITTIVEFVGKEIAIDLTDLTPKAADNLSLRDMDVTIFYRAESDQISDLYVKYANAHQYDQESDSYFPAYRLVFREARRAAYETVARIDSLTMHKKREQIADSIKIRLQETLDANDPGVFQVTRIVIRSVLTDPSIEASIREAVANQKRLEAKQVMVEIERKNAEIEAIRAQGIANANEIINETLTNEYLQHELNLTLQKFAETGANTIVVPANMRGFEMILPTDKLARQ